MNATRRRCPVGDRQAGRGLAIGACASALWCGRRALLSGERRARSQCLSLLERTADLLWALAQAEYTGKRTCTARTLLSLWEEDGTPLFRLEVDYNVLSAAAFTRLFGQAKLEMRAAPRPADGACSAPRRSGRSC